MIDKKPIDKNISTEYTGVYTGIFPNMSPREIELEARVKDLEERIINHSNTVEEYCDRLANKEKECEELKSELHLYKTWYRAKHGDIKNTLGRYRKALEEIEIIAKDGLNPICYKSNCSRCQCYDGDDCNARMNALINNYFTDGEFFDDYGDFAEEMEALLVEERISCNKAKPISQQILDIINKAKGEE